MEYRLLANVRAERERFQEENFCGKDDFFVLVETGEFSVQRGQDSFLVQSGEGFFFQRGVCYQRKITRPAILHVFRYCADAPLFKSEHVTFADTQRVLSTAGMLSRLNEMMFQKDFSYRVHLFSDIVTQYAMENSLLAYRAVKTDRLMQKEVAAIRKKIAKLPNVEQLAQRSGLSYVQYLRRFRAFTGMQPTDYIAAVRLQKAKDLLEQTDLMIKEIAPLCGFENEYYFCNFFKKHVSVSPSAYRRLIK